MRFAQWLQDRALNRDAIHLTFYSDSPNDLPLLEHADKPIATNPDARLRDIATARGWRILDLFSST